MVASLASFAASAPLGPMVLLDPARGTDKRDDTTSLEEGHTAVRSFRTSTLGIREGCPQSPT